MVFTRLWRRTWQSQCSQLCAGRLQSPLWTPLAAVPGVTQPLPTHTSYPTRLPNLQFLFRSNSLNSHIFNTQAHIPRWWDGSRKEGFPCQDQRQCGGWGHLEFFLLIFCYAQQHRLLSRTVYSECGGQLEGSSGVLQSPGYPHSFPHRHMCLWTITVPEGRQASSEELADLKIHTFSL